MWYTEEPSDLSLGSGRQVITHWNPLTVEGMESHHRIFVPTMFVERGPDTSLLHKCRDRVVNHPSSVVYDNRQ